MSAKTGIAWTDKTWNPTRGCKRVSEGCRHCYAERVAGRFGGPGQPYEGLVRYRSRVSGLSYDVRGAAGDCDPVWTGEARFVPEMLSAPLHWREPCRIFVNSMSDLFHEDITNEQIAAVFGVMAACPQHTFQVLTKRPKRMVEWFGWVKRELTDEGSGRFCSPAEGCRSETLRIMPGASEGEAGRRRWSELGRKLLGYDTRWPIPNAHLGVSVENQKAADERIPLLLQCPAAVRWVSCEPLLGAVDLSILTTDDDSFLDAFRWNAADDGLDWVVCGGESGPNARPMHPEWARSLRDQCREAGVPFFFKQWGEWLPGGFYGALTVPDCLGNRINSPGVSAYFDGPNYGKVWRIGKRIAGSLLDGVEHKMFPGDKW